MNTIQLCLLNQDNAFTKSSAKRFEDLLISSNATYTKTEHSDGEYVEFEVECNMHLSYVIIELLAYQSMSRFRNFYNPEI